LSIGCVGPGLLTDGTSVSVGRTIDGYLRHAAVLPPTGDGYEVPARWRPRERRFATDELVRLVKRVARRVRQRHPGSVLGVADMSQRGGGPIRAHYTHASGRDVDLLYYATDVDGKPARPRAMTRFNQNGHGLAPLLVADREPDTPTRTRSARLRRFDVARNWALVKTLALDESGLVEWIFIARHLSWRLTRYARRTGEPEWLIERAAWLMCQPSNSTPHANHMHVRVFCTEADRALGCRNRVPPRRERRENRYRSKLTHDPTFLAGARQAFDLLAATWK
jgi:penicillin-insensitive murein endopeptidase